MRSLSWTFLQEQRVQRNVVAASAPRQPPRLGAFTIGGPPPAHIIGAGPSGTLVTQAPATQPLPAPHLFEQLPQWLLSFAVSTHVWSLAQRVRPGRHEVSHAPP